MNDLDAERRSTAQSRLLHGDITHAILGGSYAVHSQLGYGFLENVYANALAIVLREAGLHVQREVRFEIIFHGQRIGYYKGDLVVESKVLVETKADRALNLGHCGALRNYLSASKLEVGLLINFGNTVQSKRVIWTPGRVIRVGHAHVRANCSDTECTDS